MSVRILGVSEDDERQGQDVAERHHTTDERKRAGMGVQGGEMITYDTRQGKEYQLVKDRESIECIECKDEYTAIRRVGGV